MLLGGVLKRVCTSVADGKAHQVVPYADTAIVERWRADGNENARALTVLSALAVILAVTALIGVILVAYRLLF